MAKQKITDDQEGQEIETEERAADETSESNIQQIWKYTLRRSECAVAWSLFGCVPNGKTTRRLKRCLLGIEVLLVRVDKEGSGSKVQVVLVIKNGECRADSAR